MPAISSLHPTHPGVIASVVTPGECNLRCAHCITARRGETLGGGRLTPNDMSRFLIQASKTMPIRGVTIQGEEPLLPSARPYTQAVLTTGRLLGLPTGLVSNGVLLEEATDWLRSLAPSELMISVDAASPERHDGIRGVPGAWSSTIKGVEKAAATLSPQTSFAIASTLVTTHKPQLEGMPELLSQLGVERWIVTPLLRIGGAQAGGLAAPKEAIYERLLELQMEAEKFSVHMSVDDELNCLNHGQAITKRPALGCLDVRSLPQGTEVIRLTPDGRCSLGLDILKRVGATTPRWSPDEDAGRFLDKEFGLTMAAFSSASHIYTRH